MQFAMAKRENALQQEKFTVLVKVPWAIERYKKRRRVEEILDAPPRVVSF